MTYHDVGGVLARIARSTQLDALPTAAALLRVDLERSGIQADADWCRQAIQAARRGDSLRAFIEGSTPS